MDEKPILHLIPHTHWEGAVFFTREEYLDQGLSHIMTALKLLREYPEYRFTLDQAAYVEPFIERYPELESEFRHYVNEGRLQLVGGMDIMPDDVKPGGELFVRQIQYGQHYFSAAFGKQHREAWLLDTFGHHPQMPQLLRQSGFDSMWFSRGVRSKDMPSEFVWRGIDGTEIDAVWLPGFYGLFYGPPRDQAGFDSFFSERYASLDPFAQPGHRVGLAGADVTDAEQHVPDLVRGFNQERVYPLEIRFSTPAEFMAIVRSRRPRKVYSIDMCPIFQGTFSSRIELHQLTRRIERKLLDAEFLGAMASVHGKPVGGSQIWQAWEPVLFNQAHDTASGVMTDIVYEDTLQSYFYSERLADSVVDESLDAWIGQIDTTGEGAPIVVVNTLGFERKEAVEIDLGFAEAGIRSVVVFDPDGRQIPVQLSAAESYEDGSLRRAKAHFIATLPPLGYAVYFAQGSREMSIQEQPNEPILENEFVRIAIDPSCGTITSLFDKRLGKEMLSGPANAVAQREDNGDIWELYKPLDGGMYLCATEIDEVPGQETYISNSLDGEGWTIVSGPVYQEFAMSRAFPDGLFSTRIRLTKGSSLVECEIRLTNMRKHVRYQALIPTVIQNGVYTQEIPFGAVERLSGVENPAQNWTDVSNAEIGLAVLNRGLPGNVAANGTHMVSLLRSVDLIGYNFGRPSETAFEIGVDRTFQYALLPHKGTWKAANTVKEGQAYNAPLLVRKTSRHEGKLPKTWSLAEVEPANVVVTSVHWHDDGLVVRVYESAGLQNSGAHVRFNTPINRWCETDLLEKPTEWMDCLCNECQFDLRPFEIKTYIFEPRAL